MSTKTKEPAQPMPDNEDFLKYIIVPPDLAIEMLKDNSDVLESIPLREEGKDYQLTSEDKWVNEDSDFSADISYFFDTSPKFVVIHVPHNGRFYSVSSAPQIAGIIKSLCNNEATKLIN